MNDFSIEVRDLTLGFMGVFMRIISFVQVFVFLVVCVTPVQNSSIDVQLILLNSVTITLCKYNVIFCSIVNCFCTHNFVFLCMLGQPF